MTQKNRILPLSSFPGTRGVPKALFTASHRPLCSHFTPRERLAVAISRISRADVDAPAGMLKF